MIWVTVGVNPLITKDTNIKIGLAGALRLRLSKQSTLSRERAEIEINKVFIDRVAALFAYFRDPCRPRAEGIHPQNAKVHNPIHGVRKCAAFSYGSELFYNCSQ